MEARPNQNSFAQELRVLEVRQVVIDACLMEGIADLYDLLALSDEQFRHLGFNLGERKRVITFQNDANQLYEQFFSAESNVRQGAQAHIERFGNAEHREAVRAAMRAMQASVAGRDQITNANITVARESVTLRFTICPGIGTLEGIIGALAGAGASYATGILIDAAAEIFEKEKMYSNALKRLDLHQEASNEAVVRARRDYLAMHHPDRFGGYSQEVIEEHQRKLCEIGTAFVVIRNYRREKGTWNLD